MKVIVTSLGLFRTLKSIPQSEMVQWVRVIDGKLILKTNNGTEYVHYCGDTQDTRATAWFNHYYRRWDWVRDTLGQISEQPIVVDISENELEILIQF